MSDLEGTTTLDQNAPEAPASDEVREYDTPELEGVEPEGEDTEIEDDEFEEIEHGGRKHKLPKDLKPLLMMQQDYTKKTQEVAEARKALEAQRTQQAEEAEEVTVKRADLRNADKMIEAYKNLDWAALEQEDWQLAQTRMREYQQWKDHRDELKTDIAQVSERRALETQQATAKRSQEAVADLTKAIPNWNAVAPKVAEFAMKELGYTPKELGEMADSRLGKLMHRAWMGSQLLAKQQAAAKTSTTSEAEPVKPSTAIVKGRAPAAPSLSDRLSSDEWMKRRETELRARK